MARSLLSRIGAQINVFDKGATFQDDRRDAERKREQKQQRLVQLNASRGRDTRNIFSKAYDQVNVFDNNRTYKQATPTANSSLVKQAQNLGKKTGSVVVEGGQEVFKAPFQFALNYANTFGNLGERAAGGKQKTIQQNFSDPFTGYVRQKSGATGTNAQLAGSAITNLANIIPGGGRLTTSAAARLLPKSAPNLVARTVGNAAAGSQAGGVSNLGAYLSSGEPITAEGLNLAYRTGALFGGALGTGGTLAKPALVGTKQATLKVPDLVRRADKATFGRNNPTVTGEDISVMSKFQDYLLKTNTPNARVTPTKEARQLGKKWGVDVTTGTPREISARISTFLDENKAITEGGFVKVPTSRSLVDDVLPDADEATKSAIAKGLDDDPQALKELSEYQQAQLRQTADNVTPPGAVTPQQATRDALQQASQDSTPSAGIAADLQQASLDAKNSIPKKTVAQKLREAYDQDIEAVKLDEARAKALGIPVRDLPKSQSLEARIQQSRASNQASEQFLRKTTILPTLQKYADAEGNWNQYRLFMRHAEQRADGRPGLFNVPDEQINGFITDFESRFPSARQDLANMSADFQTLQRQAQEVGTIGSDDLGAVNTKSDGTKYQFWTPARRQLPDELERPMMSGGATGSIARQKVLQDYKGGDLPFDFSFTALKRYSDDVHKDIAKTQGSQLFAENVQQGLVPGARFIQTSDNAALQKEVKQTLQDLQKEGVKLKVSIRQTAANTRVAAVKKNQAESVAATKARQLLVQSIDDPDARAAIGTLTKRELTDSFLGLIDNKSANVERARANLVKKGGQYEKLAYELEKKRKAFDELKDTNKGLKNLQAELTTDPTTGRQIVSGIDNGNTFKIEVDPKYARLLQGLDKQQLDSAFKAARTLQEPIRVGTTGAFNPVFTVLNAGFDAIMSPTLSPQGVRVLAPSAVAEGFKSLFANTAFKQAIYERGARRFTGSSRSSDLESNIESLIAEKSALSKLKYTVTNPKAFWQSLDLVGGRMSEAARTGVAKAAYDARLRKNGSMSEALDDAAYAYNNVLPNFSNISQEMRKLDSVLMYAGASQAGTRSFLRAIKRDPVGVGSRLSLLIGGLTSAAAYTIANAEEYFDDMENAGKSYIIDNSANIVLPGAHKVTKEEAQSSNGKLEEGEWTGVIKIPLPPELRPFNRAVRNSIQSGAGEQGVPIKDLALATVDVITGGARTLNNPVVNIGMGVATGVDPRTGRVITDQDNTDEDNKRSQQQFVARSFGLPGRIIAEAQEGKSPVDTLKEDFTGKFSGAKGTTSGQQFYKDIEKDVNELGLTKNEKEQLRSSVIISRKNAQGETVTEKSYYDTAQKATALLESPKLLEISRRQDRRNRAAGKPGDPFFNLTPEQQRVVLNLQANYSPGNKEEKAIAELNPWLKDFNKKRSEFYDEIKASQTPEEQAKSGIDPGGLKIPKAQVATQKKLDFLSTIKDSKQKSKFIRDNQDVTDYLAEQNNYQRAKRDLLGLPQFDEYPKAAPELQKALDFYNKLPKGNGPLKKDGTPSSPDRSAWIKSNPGAWDAMSGFFDKVALWQAAEEGSLAVYEGIDFENDTIQKLVGEASSGSFGGGKGRKGSKGGKYDPTDPTHQKLYLEALLPKLEKITLSGISNIDVTPQAPKLKYRVPARPKQPARIRLKI